jgi:amino acid transporter
MYALSRDGRPSLPLARISMPSGAPRRAVEVIIGINVALLLIFQFAGVSGFAIWQYLGTLGTLSILVGYAMVCIAASRAAINGSLQIAKWKAILPILAAIAVAYTLYNQIVPAPAHPYNVFPYIVLAWLIVGAALVIFAPHLARRMGDGLTRTLGIPELGGPHHQHHDAGAESDLSGLAEDRPPTA